MKAAIVTGFGQTPKYGNFEDPSPKPGEEKISVIASALSNFTKGSASGYLGKGSGSFPFVAGVDGVGWTEDRRRVYFLMPRVPFGAIAQSVVVPSDHCITLPDGVDDVIAAAIANPGMSAWSAFKDVASMKPGDNVLINGATGIAGKLAVQIAKHLGARKIIATGRNAESLAETKVLGADVTIPLTLEPNELEVRLKEQFAENGVNVVVDYLWGNYAETLISVISKDRTTSKPIRYVQVGALTDNISLSGMALRSTPLMLMGRGFGSVSFQKNMDSINDVMMAIKSADLKIKTQVVSFKNVEEFWGKEKDGSRIVFVID